MSLRDYIINGKVLLRRESYAIIKAKTLMPGAFAIIRDGDEITVVIDHSRIVKQHVIEVDSDWRMLTFQIVLPLDLVGFLAEVSRVLADRGVSILALSAYSTDHILVKEKDIGEAVNGLVEMGFTVEGI
jgi:hypothetical protein